MLVTLRLDRNPMPSGEPTWIEVSVRNVGPDTITWFHDGCADPVTIRGRMESSWREGLPMRGDSALFKRYALGLDLDGPGPVPVNLVFVPEDRVGRGPYGCDSIGLADTIEPGQVLERRLQWNGLAADALGPAPAGPVTLDAQAGYFWRTSEGEPTDIPSQTIGLTLTAWVDPGPPGGRLDPPEIIDVALTDPEFAAWLATKAFANGVEQWVRFVPAEGHWEVGAIEWNPPDGARLMYLEIDPFSGVITARVDRAWDQQTDPMP